MNPQLASRNGASLLFELNGFRDDPNGRIIMPNVARWQSPTAYMNACVVRLNAEFSFCFVVFVSFVVPESPILLTFHRQNLPLAIAAPCASALSLAQTTSGSTPPDPT
jgi:hypothetical protein